MIDDIPVVFNALDGGKTDTINCDDFVEELYKLIGQDTQSMLVFVKAFIMDVRNKVTERLDMKLGELGVLVEEDT